MSFKLDWKYEGVHDGHQVRLTPTSLEIKRKGQSQFHIPVSIVWSLIQEYWTTYKEDSLELDFDRFLENEIEYLASRPPSSE